VFTVTEPVALVPLVKVEVPGPLTWDHTPLPTLAMPENVKGLPASLPQMFPPVPASATGAEEFVSVTSEVVGVHTGPFDTVHLRTTLLPAESPVTVVVALAVLVIVIPAKPLT
jgi:hypothetical protein